MQFGGFLVSSIKHLPAQQQWFWGERVKTLLIDVHITLELSFFETWNVSHSNFCLKDSDFIIKCLFQREQKQESTFTTFKVKQFAVQDFSINSI